MQIIISGKEVDLTEAIESYVNKKIEGLDKFFKGIIRAEVTLGRETHHHLKGEIFFAECKLAVPSFDVFAKQNSKDLYSAIDSMRDHLEAELKKHKAKLQGDTKKNKATGRANKEYQPEE